MYTCFIDANEFAFIPLLFTLIPQQIIYVLFRKGNKNKNKNMQSRCFITPLSLATKTTFTSTTLTSNNLSSLRKSTVPITSSKTKVKATPTAAAWPIARFLSNFIFYTPLGKVFRSPSKKPNTNKMQQQSTKTILVTGGSGATGSRVISLLLKHPSINYTVVALTRSRERLFASLRSCNVQNIRELESSGKLRIVVSDMFNVPEEGIFDIHSCISCTGTRVGPKDDDEQRSKYYQGIVLYPAEILEDTPENVEYVSIKRLCNLVDNELSVMKDYNIPTPDISLFDYRVNKNVSEWGILDDVVMGGVSKSNIRYERGGLVFEGIVSIDNNGGFASSRTSDYDEVVDYSKFDGIQLRVRGDGNRYKFILRNEKKWDGNAHCVSFDTNNDGKWQLINLSFDRFNTVKRGKSIKDESLQFNPSRIIASQLMLSKFEYDGNLNPNFKAGEFQLTVASIRPYTMNKTKTTPGWIQLSSAAVTRPQRLAQVRGTDADVPILQLNEKIGRLLDWKLAGEDCIRQTNIPYTIVRSTALTVDDGKGINELRFDQGDLMNGRVSRDDIAGLLVHIVECGNEFIGKTFEVNTKQDGEEDLIGSIGERGVSLKSDNDIERSFGPFPYVPETQQENKINST